MSENEIPGNEVKKEPENVISDYYDGVKELKRQVYESGIRKARNALFVTAGILLLGEIITISRTNLPVTSLAIAVIAVEVGAFIALAFWTKTKPYTAIIVGLIIFLLLWGLAIATVGTRAIYSGIILRIVVIALLINALKPAKEWENLKKNS